MLTSCCLKPKALSCFQENKREMEHKQSSIRQTSQTPAFCFSYPLFLSLILFLFLEGIQQNMFVCMCTHAEGYVKVYKYMPA